MAKDFEREKRKAVLDVLIVSKYIVYGIHKEEGFEVTNTMLESNKFLEFYKGDFFYLKNKLEGSTNLSLNLNFMKALDHEFNDKFLLNKYYKNFLVELTEKEVYNRRGDNFVCYGVCCTMMQSLGSLFRKLKSPKYIQILYKE